MSPPLDRTAAAGPPNTLAPSRPKRDEAGERSTAKGDVPAALLDRYLVERDRRGRAERFFRDHRATEPAFRDTGRSLATTQAYPDIVADMLKVAQHRGWTRVAVRGDEAFRRDVWIQGQALGLEVSGYRARSRDRQAAGEPPDVVRDREAANRLEVRLRRAATVVRAVIADPQAQRRLVEYAAARVGLTREPERPDRLRTGTRDRDR